MFSSKEWRPQRTVYKYFPRTGGRDGPYINIWRKAFRLGKSKAGFDTAVRSLSFISSFSQVWYGFKNGNKCQSAYENICDTERVRFR